MAVHKGKMFPDTEEGYDAYHAYGIGAMCWTIDGNGHRWLQFLAPDVEGKSRKGYVPAAVRTMTDGRDWMQHGQVCGWNGNLESPTFHPSIWLRDKRGWHGFIENGNLRDA